MATPIGNLGDISRRALETLQAADLVLCEDTRVTRKLMTHFGLSARLESCHEHNQISRIDELLARLAQGQVVVLVSDAGMPLISDPGAPLVQAVIAAGAPLTVVPGANAALSALSLSGLPGERFCFCGFLPVKSGARRAELAELAAIPATLIFYESPSRTAQTLADMALVLGQRPAALARELTKLHEEVVRGTLPELAALAAGRELRGEVVLVVGPAPPKQADEQADVDALLRAELGRGSLKDAVAVVTARTGLPKREVYARAVALTQGKT